MVEQHENYCICRDCGYLARGGKFPSKPTYESDEIADPYCPKCNSDMIFASSIEEVMAVALQNRDIEGYYEQKYKCVACGRIQTKAEMFKDHRSMGANKDTCANLTCGASMFEEVV